MSMTIGVGVATMVGTIHTGALAMAGADTPITTIGVGVGTIPGDGTAGAGVATTVVGTVHIGAGAMLAIGAGEVITTTVGAPITITITMVMEETMPTLVDAGDIPLPQFQAPPCEEDPTWPQEQVDIPQGIGQIVAVPIDRWAHPERLDHIIAEQRPEEPLVPTLWQETKITEPAEVPVLLPTTTIVPEATVRMALRHHPEVAALIAGVEP